MNIEVYNSESFKTVADSIREKASTENKLSFPDGFLKNIRDCNDSLIKRFTLESYSSEKITKIPKYAFYKGNIKNISFLNALEIDSYAFGYCDKLDTLNLTNVEKINQYAFANSTIQKDLSFSKNIHIEPYAFSSCTVLGQVSLPENETITQDSFARSLISSIYAPKVKIIESNAFKNSDKLETIDFPETIEINNGAFSYCNNLTTVNLPNLTTAGESIFNQSTKVKTVNCPNLEVSGGGFFDHCLPLISVNLPKIKRLEWSFFYNCNALMEVNLPNVEYIGPSCFSGCFVLPSLSLPKLTYADSNCFYRCYAMTSVDLPNLETSAGGIFGDCYALTNVNVPKLTSIPGGTFNKCNSLTKVELPSVTSVAQLGIRNSSVLKEVIFGTKISSFANQAFYQCPALDTIVIQNTETVATMDSTHTFENIKITSTSGSIYVPDALVDSYKTATNWSVYASQIKPLSEYVAVE